MGHKSNDKMAMHSTTFLIAMKCQGELREEAPQYVQNLSGVDGMEEGHLPQAFCCPSATPQNFL